MGTRSLGDRPWLVADIDRDRDLAIKRELLETQRHHVLYETKEAVAAARVVADLAEVPLPDANMHPIEAVARHVQEDLCLLRRLPDGWHLDASCLCFPTRWHLRDKVGQHIAAVHGPVDGYAARITDRVDRLFDQLTERPVWRRNWFLMTDPTLHQPDRPPAETIISADRVDDDLYIRSERQTLRRVADEWVLFTIRIQQATLGQLLDTDQRVAEFLAWVDAVSDDFAERRHLSAKQRTELQRRFS